MLAAAVCYFKSCQDESSEFFRGLCFLFWFWSHYFCSGFGIPFYLPTALEATSPGEVAAGVGSEANFDWVLSKAMVRNNLGKWLMGRGASVCFTHRITHSFCWVCPQVVFPPLRFTRWTWKTQTGWNCNFSPAKNKQLTCCGHIQQQLKSLGLCSHSKRENLSKGVGTDQ